MDFVLDATAQFSVSAQEFDGFFLVI